MPESMPHVALLRGINVGSSRRIAMQRLREIFAELGHPDAVTHLQSGNVIFGATAAGADDLATRLEAAIEAEFRLRVRVLVRSRDDLAAVVAGNPMPERTADPARLLVAFLSEAPLVHTTNALGPAAFFGADFAVRGRETYLFCPETVKMTLLSGDVWEKSLAVTATLRNWNTVTRLASMTQG
ncbi:DUF1697 domain-containing protein [Dactylosporangium vinaceum]|uniref:DUF1697 domain-containing protein n=1 Tax=Dactylosporangium vinaceum TaxID=53362 RepID=A0ABV5MQV2_9ACTN|nr:DUF1697 domain-containing protein [Dactylosporangium vinaceum]UAB93869.1 DUF1697 domain-containing protein [Dactylosporangium vinaceum]